MNIDISSLLDHCRADQPGAAYEEFLRQRPEYGKTLTLDELRRRDYSRIDRLGHVYLDHTGAALYADSQLDAHHALLRESVLGNPHSNNPTSLLSTTLAEEARRAVLDFFRACPDEYCVVFTPNATAALRLVGEAYPFAPGGRLLLTYDNHNSVNGIREFARRKGADVRYVPVTDSELRVDARLMSQALADTTPGRPHLFAFPLQSNFSGVQHPLSLVDEAQAHGFDVLVDAAAFVPTNRLDLSVVRPDFVCISFYKMFGYPTGIGALLARHKNLEALERPWFAGGTITVASVEEDGGWYRLAPGPAGFEDGTVDFLGLPAVTVGLRHLAAIGIDLIHQRVITLASWLLEVMVRLRHTNGAPLVRVFGPATMEERGATIAFLLMDPAGEPFDVPVAQEQAVGRSISLRTGCFCNPGDGEVAHHLTRDDMAPCFFTPTPLTFDQCGSLIRASTGKSPNTMRVSLGLVSDFSDLFRFVQFASAFRDRSARDVLA